MKSLNQKIVTGGDKLGHSFYNWLTMHPDKFKKRCLKFSSQGGVTSMRWHVNGWQFFSASQWYLIWKHQTENFICPISPCLWKKPNTLFLNTIIKYNMNKRSEPLFQKSNFSPSPGSDKFLNFFITPPKTFQLSLGVAGKENTDFVSLVTILPIFAAKRLEFSRTFRPRSKSNKQHKQATCSICKKHNSVCKLLSRFSTSEYFLVKRLFSFVST